MADPQAYNTSTNEPLPWLDQRLPKGWRVIVTRATSRRHWFRVRACCTWFACCGVQVMLIHKANAEAFAAALRDSITRAKAEAR